MRYADKPAEWFEVELRNKKSSSKKARLRFFVFFNKKKTAQVAWFNSHNEGKGSSRGHPPLEKVLLIGFACLWTATTTSGTRGACVVSADQAPRRARSMGACGSGIFNGVTQSASLFAFQSLRHATLFISTPLYAFQSLWHVTLFALGLRAVCP